MIEISISRNPQGFISQIEVNGHSGYASEGYDIVCAAASTVIQSIALGADEVIGYKEYELAVDDGYFRLDLRNPDAETMRMLNVLTETAYLTLSQLQDEYPSYVRISG